MLRLVAAMLVRVGLVLTVMAVLVRLVPMPNRADVMADDFAIAVSLALVLVAAVHLRLTRDTAPGGPVPGSPVPGSPAPGASSTRR
jgi:hypothetical protein